MISKDKFQEGVELFNATRADDELDLITKVRGLLTRAGLEGNLINFDNHNLIQMAKDKTSDVQRHLLNRYWSFQLASASADKTFDARFALIPNGSTWDWLKLFEEKVLPVCVEFNLPK